MHRALALIILIALSLSGQTVIESVVAKVDDTVVLYSDILQEGALLNLENGLPIQTPLSPQLKEKILDSLVVRIMLLAEVRERMLPVSEQMVSEMIASYEKLPYLSDFTKRFELSPAAFRMIVKRRIAAREALNDHIARLFAGKLAPTEEQKRVETEKWIEALRKKHRIVYFAIP